MCSFAKSLSCGVSFSIEVRRKIAQYVFAAAVSVAEDMRASLAAIGEEYRYAGIVSVSRVCRVREAFKIKAPRIGENIGNLTLPMFRK